MNLYKIKDFKNINIEIDENLQESINNIIVINNISYFMLFYIKFLIIFTIFYKAIIYDSFDMIILCDSLLYSFIYYI